MRRFFTGGVLYTGNSCRSEMAEIKRIHRSINDPVGTKDEIMDAFRKAGDE